MLCKWIFISFIKRFWIILIIFCVKKELKAAFQPHGLLLSAAVGAGKETIDKAYEIAKIGQIFDFLNLMTYVSKIYWVVISGLTKIKYIYWQNKLFADKINVSWLNSLSVTNKIIGWLNKLFRDKKNKFDWKN